MDSQATGHVFSDFPPRVPVLQSFVAADRHVRGTHVDRTEVGAAKFFASAHCQTDPTDRA